MGLHSVTHVISATYERDGEATLDVMEIQISSASIIGQMKRVETLQTEDISSLLEGDFLESSARWRVKFTRTRVAPIFRALMATLKTRKLTTLDSISRMVTTTTVEVSEVERYARRTKDIA